MNWEAIGAIGEILGAVAVLVTLVYLTTQIKQNTRTTRAKTYSSTTDGWHNYMQGQTVEDIDLLISLARTPSELSTAEFYRAYYLCRVLFRRMEHDYYQFKAGTFESNTWDSYVRGFERDTFNNPAIRVMWALQSGYVDPTFRSYMQSVVDRASSQVGSSVQEEFNDLLSQELK